MPPKIVVITGPTATGKSALGLALAKKCRGEIVSADSMQIYRYMDIGTAKPSAQDMAVVPHHMINIASPFERYSVAKYVEDAAACIEEILSRGALPIVVGGTGLYIESLISNRSFAEQSGSESRTALYGRYDQLGGEQMLRELKLVDPHSAGKLHANDKKRIVRALEIYETTGLTITEHDEMTRKMPPRYDACIFALTYSDRADLYARINRRVDNMMENGLLEEVRKLLSMGLTQEHTAMQAIGYKELLGVLQGRCAVSEAVEQIKMESRRYAKRQLSWLRRDEKIKWIPWGKEPDFDSGLAISTKNLEELGYNIAVWKQN